MPTTYLPARYLGNFPREPYSYRFCTLASCTHVDSQLEPTSGTQRNELHACNAHKVRRVTQCVSVSLKPHLLSWWRTCCWTVDVHLCFVVLSFVTRLSEGGRRTLDYFYRISHATHVWFPHLAVIFANEKLTKLFNRFVLNYQCTEFTQLS